MFVFVKKAVLAFVLFRFLSGCIEIGAAFLMLYLNDIEKSLIINSSLAMIGPFIFITTTIIGLYSIADKISFANFIWIIIGVSCILYGVLTG